MEMNRVSYDEEVAVKTVLSLARQWGFGNMIAHLKREWAKELMKIYGFDSDVALRATEVSAYPLGETNGR